MPIEIEYHMVELFECFPKTISAVSYNQGSENEIQKISVSLAFKS